MKESTSYRWLWFYLILGTAVMLAAILYGRPAGGQCIGGQCFTGQGAGAQGGRQGWTPARPVVPVQRPHPAVVRIAVEERGGTSYGSGTLVRVNEKYGLVLTNWHVLRDGCGKIAVTFPSGFKSLARVQKTDRQWDLAALVIWKPPASVGPVTIASRRPVMGSVLRIAGFGRGVFRTVAGRVVQFVSPGRGLPFEIVEVAVAAREGDSGGPIFNASGQLVGVLFGTGGGRTLGSHCERIQIFLADVIRRPTPSNPKPSSPEEPSVDPCAELRVEVAALRAELAAMKAKPGPPGPPGKDGQVNIQAVAAAVLERLGPRIDEPITVQILDVDGNVRQQTQAGLGGVLRFQLIPVPARPNRNE